MQARPTSACDDGATAPGKLCKTTVCRADCLEEQVDRTNDTEIPATTSERVAQSPRLQRSMIQVLTGKFFTTDDLRVTPQRGVLHTNYVLHGPIKTSVGTLKPVDDVFGQRPHHLVYEFEQRVEAVRRDGTREFMIGVGVDQILVDMAVILSFELEVTCSPNPDLVARLARTTSGPRSGAPSSFVPRVFDPEVRWQQNDPERLSLFVDDLVGLERDRFESVMRAMRRYVTALRRLDDDPSMAYALLVAAVESLVQKYDDHTTTWSDVPEVRRTAIDEALEGIAEGAARVRKAILENEHVALGRRFQAFVLDHVPRQFYRADAIGRTSPIPADFLAVSVRQAYGLRSSAVHTLSGLPDPLGFVSPLSDYAFVEGHPILTVSGLARVARAVIREFVARSPKVDFEDIEYQKRMGNIATLQLAPSLWVGRAEGYGHHSAYRYLSGFLDQLATTLKDYEKAITDLTLVLVEIEKQIKGVSPAQRRPMLALYTIYSSIVDPEHAPKDWLSTANRYIDAFSEPSIESLLAATLGGLEIKSPLEPLEAAFENYLGRRHKKNAFRLPPLLDAAIALDLAEAYRGSDDEEAARRLITRAVELYPGIEPLMALEMLGPLPVIRWQDHLGLPNQLEAGHGEGDLTDEGDAAASTD